MQSGILHIIFKLWRRGFILPFGLWRVRLRLSTSRPQPDVANPVPSERSRTESRIIPKPFNDVRPSQFERPRSVSSILFQCVAPCIYKKGTP